MSGFDQPNYTMVPNKLFELMPRMKEAELRVTLAIVRQTFGYIDADTGKRKAEDELSLTQLEHKTGLSRQAVVNGTSQGLERGTLARRPVGNSFAYHLVLSAVVNEVDQSTKLTSQASRPKAVNEVDRQVVNEVDTQKKDLKEKKEKRIAPATQDAPPVAGRNGYRQQTAKRVAVAQVSDTDNRDDRPKAKHQPIIDAYAGELPYKIPNGGQEAKAAKWLAEAGYTPAEVVACYQHLKADPFHADKHLSLVTIQKQIGAFLAAPKAQRAVGGRRFTSDEDEQVHLFAQRNGFTDLAEARREWQRQRQGVTA